MNKEEIEKDDNYWKGYVQKQKEAEEICKMCKYRKKSKTLDKVTDILKVDIEIYINSKELTQKEQIELDYAQDILNIIEREKK